MTADRYDHHIPNLAVVNARHYLTNYGCQYHCLIALRFSFAGLYLILQNQTFSDSLMQDFWAVIYRRVHSAHPLWNGFLLR